MSHKDAIKKEILSILRPKAGVWITLRDLESAVSSNLGEPAWKGALFQATEELIRDGKIQRTVKRTNIKGVSFNETLYRVPDDETPDMFEVNE
jgi:hypothetical protein